MKTTSGNNGNAHGTKDIYCKRGRTCYMAYTLNNVQPVICTIVSDQPYFYMDDDTAAYEEDALLELARNGDMDADLNDLRHKMESYDRLSQSYQRAPERRLEEFQAEALNLTEDAAVFKNDLSLLQPVDGLLRKLEQSRMALALLEFAQNHNVYLVESEQVGTARYDREQGKILIHSDLGETEQVMLAVRELRRHWQHRKGVMLHPLTFHPDHAILINRAQNADLSIAMVRVAWELQLAGDRNAWEYIENSPMADLGRAFAREALNDFRSLASGKASSAAFESWFLSERCRHQDKKLIQAMLADHQGYVFTSEDVSRTVSIELITALGEQPFGKNYLAPYARMIMSDAIFTEVRDRSNANFLWFIKFERSFRDTEQALQSGEDLTASGLLSEDPSTEQNSHDEPSVVISLPTRGKAVHKTAMSGNGEGLEESAAGPNVIYVRFGAGERA